MVLSLLCWWFGDGGTPVLIPNTAVKPICADGTRKGRVGRRQHRVLKNKKPEKFLRLFVYYIFYKGRSYRKNVDDFSEFIF